MVKLDGDVFITVTTIAGGLSHLHYHLDPTLHHETSGVTVAVQKK